MPRKRIWKKTEIALFGTVSDAALAKRLGISTAAVCQKRHSLRIPAYRKRFRVWGVTELNMLGRYSDAEIAKITHRPVEEVAEKRKSLKLPPVRGPKVAKRAGPGTNRQPAKPKPRKGNSPRRRRKK